MKITVSLNDNERHTVRKTVEEVRSAMSSEGLIVKDMDVEKVTEDMIDSKVIDYKRNGNSIDYTFTLEESEFNEILDGYVKFGISILHSAMALKGIINMMVGTATKATSDFSRIGSKISERLFKKRLHDTLKANVYEEIIGMTSYNSPHDFAKHAQQVVINDIANRLDKGYMLERNIAKTYKAMVRIPVSGCVISCLEGLDMIPCAENEESYKAKGRNRVIAYNNFINKKTEENYIALIDTMVQPKDN